VNQQLREEKRYYEEQHFRNLLTEDIIGDSPSFRRVLDQVYQVANTGTNVLILGETGVGKELVARAIHRNSPRSDKPFIRVLCSALPDTLIPSELFGHERGAFTGATQRRIGRFELANGGTIFLDETGDLPWDVQVRLLRILQDKEFERVGGNETIHSDFRLLTATNRNLEQEVKANRFRPDLYYRLNVFPILVPPLRERKNDIPLLAQHFLKVYAAKMGKIFERIPAEEMNKLLHYDWPGNVRELENIIERSTILSSPPNFRAPELESNYKKLDLPINYLTMSEMERHHIVSILQRTGWKVTGPAGAADILGINPSTLSFRMKKLGIERPRGFPKRRNGLHSLQ
jgi:transcriptional regulator with GAF, ATPase, and Fis domain